MKILITGDYAPVYHRLKSQIDSGSFKEVFGEVKPILRDMDLSIVNFETAIANPSEDRPIPKLGPALSTGENAMKALAWAGFDLLTLANNHILDYGEKGLTNVLDSAEKNGIDTVGVGRNLEDSERIYYKKIENKTLAVINCCEHEFSIAGYDSAGACPLNPVRQFKQIKEARAIADYVIVIVHGGPEHHQLPTPRMQETYRFFIEAGADAVVNHHQHCFSGYEIYEGKPIFYGLGNFCFDEKGMEQGIWTEGYMVELDFAISIGFRIIPYVQCEKDATVRILPDNTYTKRIGKLNDIIANPLRLKESDDSYLASFSEYMRDRIEPFTSRYIKGLRRRKLFPKLIRKNKLIELKNIIECESHRDKLMYMFDNKIDTLKEGGGVNKNLTLSFNVRMGCAA